MRDLNAHLPRHDSTAPRCALCQHQEDQHPDGGPCARVLVDAERGDPVVCECNPTRHGRPGRFTAKAAS